MAGRYEFRDVAPIRNVKNLDADVVGELIEALPSDDKPGALVQAAASRSHPLHGSFDWNDKTAGHSWRLHQASQIIRCLAWIDDRPGSLPVPAFVSVKTDDGQQYYTPPQIVSSRDLQLRMMSTARDDLIAWTRRYAALKSFSDRIEREIARMDDAIKRATNDVAA